MAYDNYGDEDFLTADEALESIRGTLGEIEERLKKISEENEDSASGMRQEIGQSRREMIAMRSTLQRLQSRFDNQLTVMVLSNIASGVGVAAIVFAVAKGIG